MDYSPKDAGVTAGHSPRLLEVVRERIRLRHYSLRTEQAYVGWIRRFVLANNRQHPRELGGDRIANAVAAYELYGGPCITIDFGTATSSTRASGAARRWSASSAGWPRKGK